MSIADDMGNLRQEITDAGCCRQEFLSEAKTDVSDFIAGCATQRQEMAAEQKADREQSVAALKNSSGVFIINCTAERHEMVAEQAALIANCETERQEMAAEQKADRKQLVAALKNASEVFITNCTAERQEMAAEQVVLITNCETERREMAAGLKAEITEYITTLKNNTDSLLNNNSDERTAMRKAWRGEGRVVKPTFQEPVAENTVVTAEVKVEPESKPELEPAAETTVPFVSESPVESGGNGNNQTEPEVSVSDEMNELKAKMLETVLGSAEGISLTEIGDKIGVEWRKLIRPARDLLDSGQVKKEDINYFPKEAQGQEPEKGNKNYSSDYF